MAPARQHATAPNIHVLETIVLFTPQDLLCFLSNGALVGHIWVNRLNSFTSLNEHFNKALLFLPAPDPKKEADKTSSNQGHFYIGTCCCSHHTMTTMLRLSSLEDI